MKAPADSQRTCAIDNCQQRATFLGPSRCSYHQAQRQRRQEATARQPDCPGGCGGKASLEGLCSLCASDRRLTEMALTSFDTTQAMSVVWAALERLDLPDAEQDHLNTAMAWIAGALEEDIA